VNRVTRGAKVAAESGDGLWTPGDDEMAPQVIETYKSAGGNYAEHVLPKLRDS
jgi:hypothetical protein